MKVPIRGTHALIGTAVTFDVGERKFKLTYKLGVLL